MAFIFFLLYLGVSYVHPAEIFPSLGTYHLTLWIGVIGLISDFLFKWANQRLYPWSLA